MKAEPRERLSAAGPAPRGPFPGLGAAPQSGPAGARAGPVGAVTCPGRRGAGSGELKRPASGEEGAPGRRLRHCSCGPRGRCSSRDPAASARLASRHVLSATPSPDPTPRPAGERRGLLRWGGGHLQRRFPSEDAQSIEAGPPILLPRACLPEPRAELPGTGCGDSEMWLWRLGGLGGRLGVCPVVPNPTSVPSPLRAASPCFFIPWELSCCPLGWEELNLCAPGFRPSGLSVPQRTCLEARTCGVEDSQRAWPPHCVRARALVCAAAVGLGTTLPFRDCSRALSGVCLAPPGRAGACSSACPLLDEFPDEVCEGGTSELATFVKNSGGCEG